MAFRSTALFRELVMLELYINHFYGVMDVLFSPGAG